MLVEPKFYDIMTPLYFGIIHALLASKEMVYILLSIEPKEML
jgi:hypothetical protein